MKIQKIGWIEKGQTGILEIYQKGLLSLIDVLPKKGNKLIWQESWPPRKIRITIEDIEGKKFWDE